MPICLEVPSLVLSQFYSQRGRRAFRCPPDTGAEEMKRGQGRGRQWIQSSWQKQNFAKLSTLQTVYPYGQSTQCQRAGYHAARRME